MSLLASESPTRPATNWTVVPATPRLINGQVQLQDPAPAGPARFYRTAEKP
jgi:hypothetical protein